MISTTKIPFFSRCCGVFFSLFILAASPMTLGEEAEAVFAGGCFWCMEPPFDELEGVTATVSGYSGGHVKNPDYKSVSRGHTGHYEVIKVSYDPTLISYSELLDVFWRNIDPLDDKGQFCDKGSQYLSAIFVANEEERRLARESKQRLEQSEGLPGKIATKILALSRFYPAEEYHQDYYQKNPLRYKYYRYSCGRDKRLKELWGE